MVVADSQILTESFFQSSGLAADFAARARLGIYVHVPFCPHICPYCDFVKTARFSRSDVNHYFSNLLLQFEKLVTRIPPEIRTVTVYFGGGTPSLFPPQMYTPLLDKIAARFEIEEMTLESNPFSNAERNFQQWRDAGITRMTLGAQSLNADILRYLGRKHTPVQVLENLEAARSAGIDNIQVDLIFAVKESLAQRNLVSEIEELARHGATGVSCYLLTIEPDTAFAQEKGASDDQAVLEYGDILSICERLGFEQHETSNFSRIPSIHNRLYWYGLPYLGIGTGAHGLLPPTPQAPLGRRYRVGHLEERSVAGDDSLMFAQASDKLFAEISVGEVRSRSDALQEMIFTLLRTRSGIPLAWLQQLYTAPGIDQLLSDATIRRALDEGCMVVDASHLKLAPAEKIRGDAWALKITSLLHP